MYQRILVPVDGSDTSARALREAVKIGGGRAGLRLIYVLEETYPLDAEGYAFIDHDALREAARRTGERILAQAAKVARDSGAAVETVLLDAGDRRVASVIDEDARNWPAELIVVGTHGRSGLSRLLLGSVAEGVARGASMPVLLVRGE
ncbi:MAG: universal stress protein [Nitrosomonadales bacterium]|nr:universal stress protein [Nitrosomonadales bacterium]